MAVVQCVRDTSSHRINLVLLFIPSVLSSLNCFCSCRHTVCRNGATTSGTGQNSILLGCFLLRVVISSRECLGCLQAFLSRARQSACNCRAACGWCLRAPTDDMLDSHLHRHRPERCCVLLRTAQPSHSEAQLQSPQLAVRSLLTAQWTRLQ